MLCGITCLPYIELNVFPFWYTAGYKLNKKLLQLASETITDNMLDSLSYTNIVRKSIVVTSRMLHMDFNFFGLCVPK